MKALAPAPHLDELRGLLRHASWDALIQQRHHVGLANVVSTLFIAAFVALIPAKQLTSEVASTIVFLDPALIGLSFVGAVVLMERAATLHRALAVSPLSPRRYLLAKVLSLGVVGVVSGLIVGVAAMCVRGVPSLAAACFDTMLLVWGLVLSNGFATLLGVVLAAGCRSMNQLIIRLLLATLVLFVPLFGHFATLPDALALVLVVWPTTPMLWLLDAAFADPGEAITVHVGIGSLLLLAWILVAWRWALAAVRKEILTDAR